MSKVTLGIDVSKLKLDAALWIPASRKWYSSKAPNDAAGVQKLLEWACTKAAVAPADCTVVLEATGVYHEVAAQSFRDGGCPVVIANPRRARDFAKGMGILGKSDTLDARALARYGAEAEKLVIWEPAPEPVRILRALLIRIDAVEQDLRREENRLEKAQNGQTPQLVHDSLQRSLDNLRAERGRLRRDIDDHFGRHPQLKEEFQRLQTIPGVGPATAARLLCLLRRIHFDSARKAAAFAGLNVLPFESGTSVHKPPRLSKHGDPMLRAKLYMAAIVAAQHNPPLRAIYLDMTRRGKSKMSALGALMRRLVHIAYGMLKHQADFDPGKIPTPA